MSWQSDTVLNVEQQFLVSPDETSVSELEKVVEVIAGKFEDPGFLQPVSKRVALVVAYLELKDGEEYRTIETLESKTEQLKSFVLFKPGDPGKVYRIHDRVVAVITELESRLAKATLTLEAIGRAEGV